MATVSTLDMLRYTARNLSNKMLILSEADVRRCFPVSAAISANRKALSSLRKDESGGAVVPTRIGLPYNPPTDDSATSSSSSAPADWSLFKPAAYYPPSTKQTANNDEDKILMGMKLVSIRANNPSKFNKPTVPATIMLLNSDTGEVAAIVGELWLSYILSNSFISYTYVFILISPVSCSCYFVYVAATYLTAARTAAGSALATEMALSNHHKIKDGLTLVVFGAGLQAEMHIKCIQHVVNINKLIIVNRTSERAEKLKELILNEQPAQDAQTQTCISNISVVLLSDEKEVQNAVSIADVIATTTNTCTPLFRGEWPKPGCHINGVGSYTPTMAEVDDDLIKRCEVLIDTKEALDVGDLSCLKGEGEIPNNFAGLIGDALVGNIEFGWRTDEKVDCTFFKSVGTAIQDVVSANVAVENARKENVGVNVEMQ